MEQEYKWMVYVKCFTYNHAPYITDALNGFCMQETTFPFVCTIVDDASTDGEQEVIKKYLQEHFDLEDNSVVRNEETDDYVLTFARHKTNKNCYFAVLYLKYNHYRKKAKAPYIKEWQDNCKYIAICEGDDYWIDSHKLQKQVDFLESHNSYALVRTNVNRLYNSGKMENDIYSQGEFSCVRDTFHDYLLHSWFLAPCTWMYRKSFMNGRPILDNKIYFNGDYSMALYVASKYNIGFLSDTTAVYRVLDKSASHFQSYKEQYRFYKKILALRCFYSRQESLRFRMTMWRNMTTWTRPSLRYINQIIFIPQWSWDSLKNLYCLLKNEK